MTRLAVAAILVLASTDLSAQERDRALERINLALSRPEPVVKSASVGEALRASERKMIGAPVFEPLDGAPHWGPLMLAAPQLRGEFVRVALPIGEFLADGARGVAKAHRRRAERVARRKVEAELAAFRAAAAKR